MQRSVLNYRLFPLLAATTLFSASVLLIALTPPIGGRIGRVLQDGEGLSIVGILVVVIGVTMVALFLPHTVRALFGKSAIELHGTCLNIYMFPSKKLEISDIAQIDIGKEAVKIICKDGSVRKINARILSGHEEFFEKISRYIT